jgi:hypothetical protein
MIKLVKIDDKNLGLPTYKNLSKKRKIARFVTEDG